MLPITVTDVAYNKRAPLRHHYPPLSLRSSINFAIGGIFTVHGTILSLHTK